MSRVILSENLLLEVAELSRIVDFTAKDGWQRAIGSLVSSFGIVKNASNDGFKVSAKIGSTNIVVVNAGLAFNSSMEAIRKEASSEIAINNTGSKRWLILERAITHLEQGTVTVNPDGSSNGTLVGIETLFTKVLRGQPNFPVKVKFDSLLNTEEYEVVKVTDDGNAIISGSLLKETGVKYSVVGTFTPGFQPLDANKQIYEMDYFSISAVDSEDVPTLTQDSYILASVDFDDQGGMVVSDERNRNMFNVPFVDTSSSSSTNPLASLLKTGLTGGINAVDTISANLELILEHGYTVNAYEFAATSTTNVFTIIDGQCNFLSEGDIPDNLFSGWKLVNRKNMKTADIISNTNKTIYLSSFENSMVESVGNDFIIIPKYKEIEYEVTVNKNVYSVAVPFYSKSFVNNIRHRASIYLLLPAETEEDVIATVSIRYRMIDEEGNFMPFAKLAIAQFNNINNQSETLGDSSFNVNLSAIRPEAVQRNYS